MESKKYHSIDQYINEFPKETQSLLEQVRSVIQKAAPEATETISYQIPTFFLHGNLVHFAGYKNHIGFYPGAGAIKIFEKDISKYKFAKGSIQFPIEQAIPFQLITKIVKYRVDQNIKKFKAKSLRTCKQGHEYYKTSECPTCPKCEAAKKPSHGFLSEISAPARRALELKGIKTLKQLSKYRKEELLELHGFGPSSIPKLTKFLQAEGLNLKK